MIKIYHLSDEARQADRMSWLKVNPVQKFRDYGKVIAYVNTECLNTAYMLTNHIETDWTMNKSVEMMDTQHHRSSSIGDMFQIIGDLGNSGVWIVSPDGFKRPNW